MLSAAYLRNNAACFFRQEFFHELFVLNSYSSCFNIFCSNGRLASMFPQDKRSGPLWRTTCNELIFVFLFVLIYLCVCVGGTCARLKSVCCFLNFSKTRKTIEKIPTLPNHPWSVLYPAFLWPPGGAVLCHTCRQQAGWNRMPTVCWSELVMLKWLTNICPLMWDLN